MARSALILCYHRVATVEADPWQLCVQPQHFAEQLEVLRRSARVLPLGELVRGLASGTLPRRAAALTFDDGYADNLYEAKPLLERFELPATVFLVTGAIGSQREFWWDELEQLVLQQAQLPEVLRLTLDDQARFVQTAAPPDGRGAAHDALWRLLWPLAAAQRTAALGELWAQAGARPAPRASHRRLTAAEVATLAAGGLVEIGAHTVTHPVLPWLPAPAQRVEIERSKAACEALAGRPAAGLAYPHGEASTETAALARAAGLPCACVSGGGLADRTADPFMLPRLPVGDWDGESFARRLAPRLPTGWTV